MNVDHGRALSPPSSDEAGAEQDREQQHLQDVALGEGVDRPWSG